MPYLISHSESDNPQLEIVAAVPADNTPNTLIICAASDLLDIYLETDESHPLMGILRKVRAEFLEDLDSVATVPEIYGLMYWLLQEQGIDNRGESLEETADRLGDIDIENDTDQFSDLIFHLKDAVERLYDLELD